MMRRLGKELPLHLLIRHFSILLILIILVSSCRKTEDETLPVLSINSPAAGTYFHVFDTVFVNVNVSDELNIEWLKLDIISAQNTIVVASQVRTDFSSLSESVNQPLIIDNIHIESGDFSRKSKLYPMGRTRIMLFERFTFSKCLLKRMKVYAVSNPTTSTTRIDSLSSNEFVSATEWGQQANIAAVNSWDGELMVIGENSGDILMLSGEELIPTETIAGLGNGPKSRLQQHRISS